MKTPETKTHIEIEGVILTNDLIRQLSYFQEDNNNGLKAQLNALSAAICYIASKMIDMNDEDLKKAALIIGDISLVRDIINDFRKP